MDYSNKRYSSEDLAGVQLNNQRWWTTHTMSYDWNDRLTQVQYSKEWFDEIDKRFVNGARLFAHGSQLFDRIIPFSELAGKRVLEIGCGMGLHTELMVRAGANVVAIDLSSTSVAATRARAELKGLRCDVRQMDAVSMDFPDSSFDFVWSWGVIHHSAHTGRIIKEIDRVLRPSGRVRAMVYNLGGMPAYIAMVTKYFWGFWLGRSLDEYLWQSTDGYSARFYSRDLLTDTFGIFFSDVAVVSFGQEADAIPLPGVLRRPIVRLISAERLRRMAAKRGAFLFVTASKPVQSDSGYEEGAHVAKTQGSQIAG
jgi:2-polyprenyl-3-methyl-5-hydroxy-6-metoxy-1,4-benzoquinol methylase